MNRKTRIRYVFYIVFFILGLLILFYPTIADRWNQHRAEQMIATYTQSVVSEDTVDYSKEKETAQAYNQKLVGGEVPDVFAVRVDENEPEYDALLNLNGDGMMGYVEIPVIDVYLPFFHYCKVEVLEKGAGHIAGSSLPVGGESTHSVISAHRGLPSARMFTDLNLLKIGDVFYLHVLGETLAYEVDTILTVEPDETKSLAIEEGGDYCTLVTCTPYAVNTHRLLVRGHRIPFVEEEYEENLEAPKEVNKNMIWAQLVCVLIGLSLSAVIIWLITFVQKRKEQKKLGQGQKTE